MATLGNLNVSFDARPKLMEVVYDPATQQQLLSFSLLLQVSIPHLLQELLSFQQRPEGQAVAKAPPPPPAQVVPKSSGAEKLWQAIKQGDIVAASNAIRQGGADVLQHPPGQHRSSLLHMALEAGGRADMVSLLLQARCDVDSRAADGTTPLHAAISHYSSLSPMVIRILLSSKADLAIPDAGSATPLDHVKQIAKQSASCSSPSLCQLLDEVSERPTVAVTVVENEQVYGAMFADTQNEKVVFYTELALGLYSLSQRRIVWKLNLSQLRVHSVVRGMAVNPELGTLSVLLEVDEANAVGQTVQQLIIVWPTGHPQQEEPLKLSVVGPPGSFRGDSVPPAIASSTTQATLTLLTRIRDGKVVCWRLNAACSQLTSEFKLTDRGGQIAISDNGQWLAVEDGGEEAAGHVEVWTFHRANKLARRSPKRIASIDARPESMAIISRDADSSCLLAAVQASPPGGPPAPIEVLAVEVSGSTSSIYRVQQESPCLLLRFCYESPDFLLTRHANGVVLVSNLLEGKRRRSHDDADIRSACISVDRALMVTTLRDCFRVFRTSDEEM